MPRQKLRDPYLASGINDHVEGSALRNHRLQAIRSTRPLSEQEYALLIQPKTDEEEAAASQLIWSRAAELRRKTRQVAGVVFDGTDQ